MSATLTGTINGYLRPPRYPKAARGRISKLVSAAAPVALVFLPRRGSRGCCLGASWWLHDAVSML